MKRKYMFFDIDGMLTNNATKKIVPSAQKTLDRLQEVGHFVAIATERAHYKAGGFMGVSDLHNMVCCGGNGPVINDELIINTPPDRQKAIAVYKETRVLGYGALVMLGDSIDVYDMDDRLLRQCGERKEPTNYIFRTDFNTDQIKDIYKFYISIPKKEEHRPMKKDTLGSLRFVETYPTFQHDCKREDILDMMECLGGPVEDVVVFGDDYNDLVMFDDAWFSIVMGNACDALKKKADYATECNVDDSIYKACLKSRWTSQNFGLSSSIKKGRFICYWSLIDLDNSKQEVQHFYQWKLNLLCS